MEEINITTTLDTSLFNGTSKWLDLYFKIIKHYGKSQRFDGSEGHHIYPKFIFGDNDQLVYITYRIHYLLHFLLYLHCKKHINHLTGKALFPLICMRGGKEKCLTTRREYNSKLYHQARRSFVESMKGEKNPMFGKVISEETRRKQSDARRGVAKSSEHADAISIALRGRKKSEEHINKINKNPEKIAKTAAKHLGMKRTPETCANISEAMKGKPTFNKGLVTYYDPETKEVFYFSKDDTSVPSHLNRGNPALAGKKKPRKTYHHPVTLDIKRIVVGDEIPEGYILGDPTRLGKPRSKK